MSSSGVSTATVDRNEIIERALRIVRAVSPGESIPASKFVIATNALNTMLAAWEAVDRMPWRREELSFALPLSTTVVTVGPSGDVNTARPTKLATQPRLTHATNDDVPLLSMPEAEYDTIEDKDLAGIPKYYVYLPDVPLARIRLWPVINATGYTLEFSARRKLYDFTTQDDNPDFPREWNNALIWNLAAELTAEFEVPEGRMQRIEQKAADYFKAAAATGG